MDNDEIKFADESEESDHTTPKKSADGTWNILVVDDDESVHVVTKLVLANLIFDDKPIQMFHAYNIAEAKSIFSQYPGIAVILLDVVMEEDTAGLKFVKYVREEANNQLVRIILRTGQPAFAAEEIVSTYEINDFKEKTELTGNKLDATIITALRAYRDLVKMQTEKMDIQKYADKAISETQHFLKLVTDSLPALISYILKNGTITFHNKAYTSWFDKEEAEISGLPIKDLFSERNYKLFIENFNQAMNSDESINFDMPLTHKKMGERSTNVTLVPHHAGSDLAGCFSLILDITERKQVEMNLHYLATHDILTNLFNRSYFDNNIEPAIQRAKKNNDFVAILFLDLDKFKYINDTLGHNIGDLLLVEVANRIQRCISKNDTIARLGGDEFVIMLEKIKQKKIVEQIVTRICSVLKQEFIIEGQSIYTGASIGISIYPIDGVDKQSLLKKADLAMYNVKQFNTGSCYEFYNKQTAEKISARQVFEKDLRHALENELLEVFYQPIYDLDKNAFTSIEALIRFHHPTGEILLPDSFIKISEEVGLINQIGEWVLRKALDDLKKLHNENFKVKIAVNLSANQILNHHFPKLVEDALSEAHIPGHYLELELTESILIKNMELTVKNIKLLKKLGVTIAIDDFGAGFSSFNYLNNLPIDIVKIDQSFVHQSTSNIKSAAIIASICKLMKILNISITAEGVESENQLKFLKNCACNRIQGFLLAYPITFNELKKFLQHPPNKEI